MNDKKAKYITTTLPYVNDAPHIGFAAEIVAADIMARFWGRQGYEVFFNTGTDEHGQKIAKAADAKGESRQAYVDHFAAEFKKLAAADTGLNLSYDKFIRTTDEVHQKAAQALWRICAENGDIYKKKYIGLYCVGCELFYKESELDENKCCLIHKKPVEEIEEENYFFRLSKYQAPLLEYLSDDTRNKPDWQRQWAYDFVKRGLDDLSISRQKSRMDWGVPVPEDDDQVMYVWFDALINYISTLGWPDESENGNFKKFWQEGETYQVAGKDQVRFQSIIWQAMLMSANIKTTDKIFYRGFINIAGQKMSKSLGNVISPYEMITKYGVDATRYLLLAHTHPSDDTDITWEKLDEWYTADLVNGLGNVVARVMKMAETHLNESITISESFVFPEDIVDALEQFNFPAATGIVWKQISDLDERITTEEPFKLVKTDKEAAKKIIEELVYGVYLVGRAIGPLMPATSSIITDAVLENKKPENLFGRLG